MAQQERYQSLVKFRQAVFSKDKIASESSQFHYSDVVKALMNDRAEEQLQINLMLMLQEGSNDFLTKMTTYEAVESLKSCFSQLKRTSRYNLQSHILVTVTSILLNADASDDTQLSEFVELLVESVVQVKRNHPLVRSTGCNCLREIEFFFPGTIAKHLDELWGALAKDTSWASQALAQLVALALGTLEGSCRSGLHDVPVLLSQLPLMTPMTAGTLLRSLLAVAQDTNALPPGVVKMCSSQYTLCYELPLAHFVLTAEEQPPMEALEHLRRALTSAHAGCRGLVLSWLGSSLRRLGTHELAQGSRWSLALLPAPGADAQLQGLQLQAALADGLATASAPEEALATVVVHLRSFGRWAAAVPSRFPLQLLLHILYRLYADSRESALASSVDEELSRLVVNMTMLPPFYCRSLLSFLSCIEVKFPDSMLPESVLAQAVETVAQPSRAQCLEAGLESSLLVLGVAVQRPVHVFKPKLVFRYIQRLVSSRGLSARRTWLLGNQLIDLCCSIMLYQAPDSLSSELRGVLCYLMESSEDVDVQSRAKLLYAALYALSESKARQLLQLCSNGPVRDRELDCSTLSLATFPVATMVASPPVEVVRLSRLDRPHSSPTSTVEDGMLKCSDEKALTLEPGALVHYRAFLEKHFIHSVSIACLLSLGSPNPQLNCLLGLRLSLSAPADWGVAQGLEMPVFWGEENGTTVAVSLSPKVAASCTITVTAEFTALDLSSYRCLLDPLQVHFEDLLLPMPVPEPVSPQLWRGLVFDTLWQECSAAPEAQQSVLRLASLVPGPELLKQLSERLAPWLVCREPRKGSLHAIFLAPQRRHILLAVDSLAGQLVASLLVESWQLLAPVQVFLEKLCSPESRC
ncbi:AP-5 complex subunit beta-1 isoform X1 [Ixodes scapularis]|uniref:AP-5 complex subunit beta-1 isoform X1 n=1 Tax=Ixodes scapularis TaxID=6945 RepID=UPI001C37FC1D|nr:AP-5 complex subunit beta-1 isoform X1 [Ixodes scapularis]XP_042143474.1 AP-5 complex subunit beta-1 isoform X1 [Ixodes scapularis]